MTAVTAPVQDPRSLSPQRQNAQRIEQHLVEMEERLAAFCPPGMTPARVRHSVMKALNDNQKLLDAKWQSVVMAAITITQWGLEIGQTAHVVPYKGVATPVPDYKGLIELMLATRLVRLVESNVIREADDFVYEVGDAGQFRHRPHWRDKTSPIIGAYCRIHLVAGGILTEVMNVDEIEAIRKKSHQWSTGPLPEWYARKTVIRRAAKHAPKSPRLSLLLAAETESGDLEPEVMDLMAAADVAALSAGAPEYSAPAQAPAIAQPANGYGAEDATDIEGIL